MATAQTRHRRIPLEELARLPAFYLPTVSWGGDQLAFYWDKSGRLELYVMDLGTRAVRQVSHGEVPRALKGGFVWERSDRAIVFSKDTEGNEQHELYRIDVATSEVTQITHENGTAQQYPAEFSPDNAWLTVSTNKRDPRTPEQPGQINVWKMRGDGSDYQPVTHHAFPARGGNWSSDGQWLAFNSNEDAGDLHNQDGYVVRPDGSDERRVLRVRAGSQDSVGDWHPDSRRIAVTSDAAGTSQAGILDITTGAVRWLSPEGVEERAVKFSRNGRLLACVRNEESQLRPIVYEVESGRPHELKLPGGLSFGSEFVKDDTQLVLFYSSDTTRGSLLLYDLATDTYETLLPAEYGSIDPTVFVDSTHITYPSTDGAAIPALLYTPRDIPAGERLPALIYIHGGPTGQFFRGFDPFAQFLVDLGLVVLEPNVRGSTGYGVAFRDAARKDWGGMDLEDIAAGAAYLRELPYVDPTRLVVFGGSYGGYMTFMAVTKKPDLWRAGVAAVGITDLQRLYATSMEHFKYYLREQMGDPEQDAALWADRSAINFAQNLRAKLLMVHGTNDPRCPVEQSRVFRDRLIELGRREGTDFEYIELSDEGHGSSDIEQKIRTFKILADYLDGVL
jgi:dipeptidyl aminopeptidase/acylaminoacyl peptidase